MVCFTDVKSVASVNFPCAGITIDGFRAIILSSTLIQLERASGVCASAIQRLKEFPNTLIPPTTAFADGMYTNVLVGKSSKPVISSFHLPALCCFLLIPVQCYITGLLPQLSAPYIQLFLCRLCYCLHHLRSCVKRCSRKMSLKTSDRNKIRVIM